jgi:hypothetical protein
VTTFRITEQTADVVERSYDVEAASADDAQEHFETLQGDDRDELLVHAETLRKNVEIIDVEEV